MADAIPAATADEAAPVADAVVDAAAPVEAAPVTTKKAKAPAKTLADGFQIPEGAVQLDSHEAYRVDF